MFGLAAAFDLFEQRRRNIPTFVIYGEDTQNIAVLNIKQAKWESMRRPSADFGYGKQIGKAQRAYVGILGEKPACIPELVAKAARDGRRCFLDVVTHHVLDLQFGKWGDFEANQGRLVLRDDSVEFGKKCVVYRKRWTARHSFQHQGKHAPVFLVSRTVAFRYVRNGIEFDRINGRKIECLHAFVYTAGRQKIKPQSECVYVVTER